MELPPLICSRTTIALRLGTFLRCWSGWWCSCRYTRASILIMMLSPLVVTGGLSIAALLAFPSDAVGAFTGAALAVCVGDVWMAVKLRKFPKDAVVHDCPTDIGYDVYYRSGT